MVAAILKCRYHRRTQLLLELAAAEHLFAHVRILDFVFAGLQPIGVFHGAVEDILTFNVARHFDAFVANGLEVLTRGVERIAFRQRISVPSD